MPDNNQNTPNAGAGDGAARVAPTDLDEAIAPPTRADARQNPSAPQGARIVGWTPQDAPELPLPKGFSSHKQFQTYAGLVIEAWDHEAGLQDLSVKMIKSGIRGIPLPKLFDHSGIEVSPLALTPNGEEIRITLGASSNGSLNHYIKADQSSLRRWLIEHGYTSEQIDAAVAKGLKAGNTFPKPENIPGTVEYVKYQAKDVLKSAEAASHADGISLKDSVKNRAALKVLGVDFKEIDGRILIGEEHIPEYLKVSGARMAFAESAVRTSYEKPYTDFRVVDGGSYEAGTALRNALTAQRIAFTVEDGVLVISDPVSMQRFAHLRTASGSSNQYGIKPHVMHTIAAGKIKEYQETEAKMLALLDQSQTNNHHAYMKHQRAVYEFETAEDAWAFAQGLDRDRYKTELSRPNTWAAWRKGNTHVVISTNGPSLSLYDLDKNNPPAGHVNSYIAKAMTAGEAIDAGERIAPRAARDAEYAKLRQANEALLAEAKRTNEAASKPARPDAPEPQAARITQQPVVLEPQARPSFNDAAQARQQQSPYGQAPLNRNQVARELMARGQATGDELLRMSFGEWPPKGLDIVAKHDQPIKLTGVNDARLQNTGRSMLGGLLEGMARAISTEGTIKVGERAIGFNQSLGYFYRILGGGDQTASTIGHELTHILQADHSVRASEQFGEAGDHILRNTEVPGANAETVSSLFRDYPASGLQMAMTNARAITVEMLVYLQRSDEIQARLHEVMMDGYPKWGRLPQNHEELYVALSDAGLKLPPEIAAELEQSPTIEKTRETFANKLNGKSGSYTVDLGIVQGSLNGQGQKLLWQKTLPALYADMIEMYGDKQGRERFGLGVNNRPDLRQRAAQERAELLAERNRIQGLQDRIADGAELRPPVDVGMAHYAGRELVTSFSQENHLDRIPDAPVRNGHAMLSIIAPGNSRLFSDFKVQTFLGSALEAHGIRYDIREMRSGEGTLPLEGGDRRYIKAGQPYVFLEVPIRPEDLPRAQALVDCLMAGDTGLTPEQTAHAKAADPPRYFVAQNDHLNLMDRMAKEPENVSGADYRRSLANVNEARVKHAAMRDNTATTPAVPKAGAHTPAPDTPARALQADAPGALARVTGVPDINGAARVSGGASGVGFLMNSNKIITHVGRGEGVGVLANTADLGNNAVAVAEALPGISKYVPKSLSSLAQKTNYPLAAVVVAANVYHTPGKFIEADGSIGAKGVILATDGTQTFTGMAAGGQIAKNLGTLAITARGGAMVLGGGIIAGTAASLVVSDAIDNYNHGLERVQFKRDLKAQQADTTGYQHLRSVLDDIRSQQLPLPAGHPFERHREGNMIRSENIDINDPKNLELLDKLVADRFKQESFKVYEIMVDRGTDGFAYEETELESRETARRYELAHEELESFKQALGEKQSPLIRLIPSEQKEILGLTQYFTQTPPEAVPLEHVKQHDAAMLRFIELTEKSRLGQPPEMLAALDKDIASMRGARVEFAAMLPEKRTNFDLRMELKAEMSRYDFRVSHYTKTEGRIPDKALPDHIASLDRISSLVEKITPGEASREMRAQLAAERAQAEAALQAQKEREPAVEEKKPAMPMLEVPRTNPIASAEATRQELGGLPISEQDKAMFAALLGDNPEALAAIKRTRENHGALATGNESPPQMQVVGDMSQTNNAERAPPR